jgi:hypothetical protein
MATLTTNQKIKALISIVMRIYNPEVMYTYTGHGGSEDEVTAATKTTMRTHLTIKPDDTPIVAILRMFIYYFVCGRYITAAVPLTLYPVHKDRTRTHLHVMTKPVKRGQKIVRADGRIERAPYGDFTIPHYVGSKRPTIPPYTSGGWTVSFNLTDQSFIQLRTLTRDEGVKVVLELAKHTDPKYHPPGGIVEKNLRVTEPNQGKKNRLHGVKMRAYKAEYYLFGNAEWEWAHNLN